MEIMRLRLIYFMLFQIGILMSFAQGINTFEKNKADSLNKALRLERNDTSRIKLRYEIGLSMKISSTGYWDSLISDAHKYNLSLYECRSLSALSLIYEKNDDNNSKALTCIHKALLLAMQNGYKNDQVLLFKEYYILYQKQYPFDKKKQLDICYSGLKLAEQVGDKLTAVDFYSFIATHYFFLGDFEKALKMHFKCLKIYEELNYSGGIAGALTDIGGDYLAMENHKMSDDYYFKSKKYIGELGETGMGAYICNSVGALYHRLKQYDSAYKYIYKSYRISQRLNSRQGMASSLVTIGDLDEDNGNNMLAEKKYLEALSLSKASSFKEEIPIALLRLKTIYLKRKDYKKALKVYELYVVTRDSLNSEKNRKDALQKESDYNFEKKEQENILLAQQNRIQALEINKNKYALTGMGSLMAVVLLIAFLFLRQNKIKAEQQSVVLEQKLLQSQMNPHFIFNSLNSIQQFIISRQNDRAELYLSRFATLIRELLESNTRESISVKEETAILTRYIEMEALRFKKSVSFSVTVDEKINQDHTIPHMMIQPFVENAIWHGLLPKEGDRNLVVAFEAVENKVVRCIIEDNGIGRFESKKRETMFKKKSLALSFVNDRIRLMRKTLKVDCSVNIIDKTNDAGESMGTKVIILLPLFNK